MATYLIHYHANPALWPSDPHESVALWEQSIAGADQLIASGVLRDMYVVDATQGFGTMDAESKSEVLAVVAPFFPFFTQDIYELSPWSEAKESILGAVRQLIAT